MKKNYIILLFILFFIIVACDNQNNNSVNNNKEQAKQEQGLLSNKIYFFYQNSCVHCHEALKYISANYENLPMISINIGDSRGYGLFLECVKKFNLGNRVGTPLFCFDDNYVMGWSKENVKLFDLYVKDVINN